MATLLTAPVPTEHESPAPGEPVPKGRHAPGFGLLVAGSSILAFLLLLAFAAPLFGSPYELHKSGLTKLGNPVGFMTGGHPFGTDSLGRDLLARCTHGLRMTLIIALVANLTSVGLGTVVGLCAGYFGKITEQVLMRMVDVFLSIPTVLSGLALASIVGRGMWGTVIVVTALYWAWTARLVYGEVLRLRSRGYVEAAVVHGVGPITILRRHIFPHMSSILLNIAALNAAAVVVIGAGLSYLGAGVQPPTPELGNLLDSGSDAIDYAPHMLLAPLSLTVLTVMSFVLIAEGLNRRNPLSERRSWLGI